MGIEVEHSWLTSMLDAGGGAEQRQAGWPLAFPWSPNARDQGHPNHGAAHGRQSIYGNRAASGCVELSESKISGRNDNGEHPVSECAGGFL